MDDVVVPREGDREEEREREGERKREREMSQIRELVVWWSGAKKPREDSKRSRVAEGEIKNGGGLTVTEA